MEDQIGAGALSLMVNMTAGELELLTPEQRRIWKRNMEGLTFGFDCRHDAKGRPIEQGIGSPGNLNENHFRGIGKNEGPEAEKAARALARGENPKTSVPSVTAKPKTKRRGNLAGLEKARATRAANIAAKASTDAA